MLRRALQLAHIFSSSRKAAPAQYTYVYIKYNKIIIYRLSCTDASVQTIFSITLRVATIGSLCANVFFEQKSTHVSCLLDYTYNRAI